jgi:hypothetical protein
LPLLIPTAVDRLKQIPFVYWTSHFSSREILLRTVAAEQLLSLSLTRGSVPDEKRRAPSTKNQFSLLNPNLMAQGDFRPTSSGTHLNIRAQSENIRAFYNQTDFNVSAELERPRCSQQINTWRKQTMTRFKIVGVAAILSMMIATPVFAQAAIQEPGAYAFYHPNADVLNSGEPSPGETAGAIASVPFGSSNAYASMDGNANGSFCARRYRSYDPASGTFLGHDGDRHLCE